MTPYCFYLVAMGGLSFILWVMEKLILNYRPFEDMGHPVQWVYWKLRDDWELPGRLMASLSNPDRYVIEYLDQIIMGKALELGYKSFGKQERPEDGSVDLFFE